MPMIKCYTVLFTVFSKSKHGHYSIKKINYGKTSLNKQIFKVPKSFIASPRKELIDKIIEYANSGL